MTVLLVVMTVIGNSWQNAQMFNGQVDRQVEEETLELSKKLAASVSGVLTHWRTELGLIIQTSFGTQKEDDRRTTMETFLALNKEVVAIYIVEHISSEKLKVTESRFNHLSTDPRYEGTSPEKIKVRLEYSLSDWLREKKIAYKAGKLEILNLGHQTKLPLLALVLPYKIAGKPQLHLAVMVAWNTFIASNMPKSELTRSQVVSDRGEVIVTPSPDQWLDIGRLPQHIGSILSNKSPYGLQKLADEKGQTWLVSYARSVGFDLTVVVEKNTLAQKLATKTVVRRTALWGWVFILVATLFSFFGSQGITSQLRQLTLATEQIAKGRLNTEIPVKGKDEVGILGISVQNMAKQIQRLLRDQFAKAQLEKEMEMARTVQNAFFPKTSGVSGVCDVAGFFQPASQCGGDLWGTVTLRDGSILVYIGDATGHGAGPALVTAMAYTCCQTLPGLLQENSREGVFPLDTLLEQMNSILIQAVSGSIAMTFLVMHFDPARGIFNCCNAGHTHPIVYRSSKSGPQRIKFSPSGVPLGMDPKAKYQQYKLDLLPNDLVVMYTDGLIECTNSAQKTWGKKNLHSLVDQHFQANSQSILEQIRKNSFAHFDKEPLKDDVTVVVVKAPQNVVQRMAA